MSLPLTILCLSGCWRAGGSSARTSTSTGAGAGASTSAAESRSNSSELDVREDNLGIRTLSLNLIGLSGSSCASSTGSTGTSFADRVSRVQPKHLSGIIIPNTENKNHAPTESGTHASKSTLLGESVCVTESGLLLVAKVGGDFVSGGDSGDVAHRVLDDLTVLDVDTTNGSEVTGGGVVRSDELGDHGYFGSGVDCETWAVEAGVAHTELCREHFLSAPR